LTYTKGIYFLKIDKIVEIHYISKEKKEKIFKLLLEGKDLGFSFELR